MTAAIGPTRPAAAASVPSVEGLRSEAGRAAGVLARLTLLGLVLGALVGGVGGRLAMFALIRANASATGVISDDGFEMGTFTLSGSLNLLIVGAGFGVLGAGIYAALRGLMIGPRWFQVLSISLGPAVVVGDGIVHADGVDFTLLGPLWLAIGLFLAIPFVYAALLTLLGERVIRARWAWPWTVVGLLPWVFPFTPVTVVLAVGWLVVRQAGGRVPRPVVTGVAWAARAGLAVVFVVALANIVADVRVLA